MTAESNLTKEQCASFLRDGYLQLQQLIPACICEVALEHVWRVMGLSPNAPHRWPEGWLLPPGYDFCDQREQIRSLLSPTIEDLVGTDFFDWVAIEQQIFHPIVVFPHKLIRTWRSPIELKKTPHPRFKSMYPHLDVYDGNLDKHVLHKKWIQTLQSYKMSFAIKDHDCNPLILSFVIYLHDVVEHAAGTVLWPGSHIDLEDHALLTNRRPAALVKEGYVHDGPFYEAVGRQGDVIVYARNLIHSSSINLSSRPRIALQGRIILTPGGIRHCRTGIEPRSVVEQIYDRHFAEYKRYHYFGN